MLVARATQHGVHGVSHLVKEVFHHARGQQCGSALGWGRQAEHQHHHWQLVLATFLALAATADGEVTVLFGSDTYGEHWPSELESQVLLVTQVLRLPIHQLQKESYHFLKRLEIKCETTQQAQHLQLY